jgi:hypothetical protein
MSFYTFGLNTARIPRTTTRDQWKSIHRWFRVVTHEIKAAEFEVTATKALHDLGSYGQCCTVIRRGKITTIDNEEIWRGFQK